jgi:hypothetical protein
MIPVGVGKIHFFMSLRHHQNKLNIQYPKYNSAAELWQQQHTPKTLAHTHTLLLK